MYSTFIKPLTHDVKKFFLDTLFPINCVGCGNEGEEFLCGECAATLPKVHQICVMCQKPSVGGLTHSGCKTAWGPDGLISVYNYHDPRVQKLIIAGKYNFAQNIFKTLGKILADEIKNRHPHLTDKSARYTLTPLPLHWMRLNWRGFNQAEIICQTLSQNLHLPLANVLVRCKFTKTQKDLKKAERKQNMENVFGLSPLFLKEGLGGNYILVDDVTTTGATLLEAVKVLKRNGVHKVWCLTVAKD